MKTIIKELKKEKYKDNSLIKAVKTKQRGTIPSKPLLFFEVYEREFERIKNSNKKFNLLEVGVSLGGSLWTWKEYFPNIDRIVGVDIDPQRLEHADESKDVHVVCGPQENKIFMEAVEQSLGPFDIMIDDGSHNTDHQKTTFEFMWPLLNEGGIYVIEDLATSFWNQPGDDWNGSMDEETKVCDCNGGLRFFKDLIDKQFWSCRYRKHYEDPKLRPEPNVFEEAISGLHFYEGICFIHKDSSRTHDVEEMLLHLSPEALE